MAMAIAASRPAVALAKRGLPSAAATPIFNRQFVRMPTAIASRGDGGRAGGARRGRHGNRERVHVGQPEHGARHEQAGVAERAARRADREQHELKDRRHLQRGTELQGIGGRLGLMAGLRRSSSTRTPAATAPMTNGAARYGSRSRATAQVQHGGRDQHARKQHRAGADRADGERARERLLAGGSGART